MNRSDLERVARAMVAKGKGILAADVKPTAKCCSLRPARATLLAA
jgi:fructose-bisphosphate aldolase class 1